MSLFLQNLNVDKNKIIDIYNENEFIEIMKIFIISHNFQPFRYKDYEFTHFQKIFYRKEIFISEKIQYSLIKSILLENLDEKILYSSFIGDIIEKDNFIDICKKLLVEYKDNDRFIKNLRLMICQNLYLIKEIFNEEITIEHLTTTKSISKGITLNFFRQDNYLINTNVRDLKNIFKDINQEVFDLIFDIFAMVDDEAFESLLFTSIVLYNYKTKLTEIETALIASIFDWPNTYFVQSLIDNPLLNKNDTNDDFIKKLIDYYIKTQIDIPIPDNKLSFYRSFLENNLFSWKESNSKYVDYFISKLHELKNTKLKKIIISILIG